MDTSTTRRLLLAVCCITAFTCLLCNICTAQQTSRGRDFYFCYIPNYHNNSGINSTDSLYVYVVADTVTTGTLTFSTRAGVQTTIPINITNPNTIWTYRVQYDSYELLGYNQSGFFSNANDNERPRPNSFRVQTDKDVAVYALNKAVTTSDASLIFPANVLSNEYMVLAYKADGSVAGGQLDISYTPSQFAIVATQDNTNISVTPSVPTTESGSSVKNFTLNRGQVYLFQSEFSVSNLNYDLTGTRVVANKPVAVFAGHQRTALPLEFKPPLRSRDQLFEQLLPPAFWGKSYVITPLAQPVGITTTGTDLWRVIAGEDNTVVRFNNTQIGILNRGQFLERSLTSAGLLSCSKNVMVACYKKTHSSDPSNTVPGDPFMMIIPPRRQYLTKYRYSNIQAQSNSFLQQFITVVTTRNNINSIQYDGNQLNANFLDIPNTCFAYANVSVTAGAHTLESQQPIGLYVYGYGDADSYGYVGGMALVPDVAEVDIDAGPDRLICFGDTVHLRVTGAARNIRWTPRTGLNCDTCVSVIAQPAVTTTYIVSATDSLGCDGRDTVIVNVRRFVVDAGRDTSVCPGYDSVIIRGRGVNGVPVTVRWSPPDWLACDTCLITKAKPPRTTRYILTATDSLGCIGRDTVNIVVRPPLEIDAGPDYEVCSFADSIALQVLAPNSKLKSVKWTPNPLGGIRCDTCPVTRAKAPGPITYYVTAIDTGGCVAVDSMKVKIGAATGRMRVTPNQSICFANDSATIGVISRTLSVKWTPSIGLSCDTCRVTFAKPPYTSLPFTQIYVVSGLDSAGCAFRDTVRVTVLPKATVDIFPDQTPCTSTGTTLIATGAFESVNWTPPTGISCTTCPNTVAIPPKRDIMYYARARNGNSADCEAVDSIIVKYAPGIEGQLPAQVVLCIGDSVNLSLKFGGKVKWTPNTFLTCDTCKTQTIKPNKNVRYSIEADSAGCTSRAIVDVKLSTAAKVVAPPDASICRGGAIVINATIDNVDAVIKWTPEEGLDCPTCIKPTARPTKTTTYIVSTGGAGCARFDTVVITVNDPPNVRLEPND
ncbi:MAG: IgGFc-binding protein, partial [Candidatus Kapabacteria bacterium]|nr:IgGFc-binding protein [Candidatus Kapabacteria bacterium]